MNSTNKSISILASFSTLKILSDTKKYKNSYQILSEFICYIISTQKIYTFTASEMKNKLKTVFGFNIPEAVVKTTSKNLPFVTKTQGSFYVNDKNILCDSVFASTKEEAENINSRIIDSLTTYIKEKSPDTAVNEDVLTQDLIAFLLDDKQNSTGVYTNWIGEYILKNAYNKEIQNIFRAILEGSIIYIGLNHNINETGSVTKKLTLFLGTEVLFSLLGLNGEIHKQLADDFITQVNSANLNGTKIQLRYFAEVKEEIDSFFESARYIIGGNLSTFDTVAMKYIVNNSSSSSDVSIKESDFYYKLRTHYGILLDDNKNYYSPENNAYNLESLEYTEPQEQVGWKFVSHINKLRKGRKFPNNVESEYLLVTNTKATLKASKEQSDKDKIDHSLDLVNDYAVSLSRITNILWYKLGNGFGKKNYPYNVNMVLKARVVLASSISHNVTEVYHSTRDQHLKGLITDDQLAARIITLRNKPLLPEELEGDSIEDIMDFSDEYLSRFEEEVNQNKAALEEKEKEIQNIRNQQDYELSQKDKTIAQKDQELLAQSKQQEALRTELENYKKEEERRNQKKAKRKRIFLFSINVFWKILVVAAIAGFAVFLEKKFESNIPVYVCAAVDLVALVLGARSIIKKDKEKYLSKK